MAMRKRIPSQLRDELLIEARHRCCVCPDHPVITNAHHVIEVKAGGPNTQENLVLVCGTCHDYIHRIPNLYTPSQLREYKRRWIEYCWPRNDSQLESDLPTAPYAPIVSLAKLPVTGPDLFGRDEELKVLDEAWEDPHTNIVAFIAFGGVGKSAIVNHWLRQMEKDDFRGARRIFGWSFYSRGTSERTVSADQFIDAALRFFGDRNPNAGSPWDKGQRLARLIRQQPTLLILDGIEPLQYPPGPEHGKLKDQALFACLKELSWRSDGLCIVSSRVDLTDLDTATTLAPVRRIDLDQLSPERGRALLRARHVEGSDSEIDAAVSEYHGHALALVLLAEYLTGFCDSDIRRRCHVSLLNRYTRSTRHAFCVMEAYDAALSGVKRTGLAKFLRYVRIHPARVSPEAAALRIVGLFDGPAPENCLDALRREPSIPGVTDAIVQLNATQWQQTITHLREWRLVSQPRSKGDSSLDAHPLVREYFGRKLQHESPKGFCQAHGRLYEHLRDTTTQFPHTLEEMQPLFQAVHHGCRAGRHQEALNEVLLARIRGGRTHIPVQQLGAVGTHLAALSTFFEKPWTEPVRTLISKSKVLLLNEAGYNLRVLGRFQEAEQAVRQALNMDRASSSWLSAAQTARNLTRVHLGTGRLPEALRAAGQAIEFARRSDDSFELLVNTAERGAVLHRSGSLLAANKEFHEAEKILGEFRCQSRLVGRPSPRAHHSPARIPQAVQLSCHFLCGTHGANYCALLLDLGTPRFARKRATETIKAARTANRLLDLGLDHLTQGRALHHLAMLAPQSQAESTSAEPIQQLNKGVECFRQGRRQDHLPQSLVARAAFHRDFGDRENADRDLKEALDLSTHIGLRLHETDARLLQGHMALDEDPPALDTARDSLARAAELVTEAGYHLRDADILILEGRMLSKKGDKQTGRAKLNEAITVARREDNDSCVYQLAIDQATRYLKELA